MSVYTTEVRYICESSIGLKESVGFSEIENVLEKSKDKVFNFDFPIFDENYRGVLEKKILRHFYTREIGFESVGLWKLKLCTKLNEIMPLYNQFYKSELLEFNPFYDTDYSRSYVKNADGTSNTQNNTSSTNNTKTETENTTDISGKTTTRVSDTPQGGITGIEDNSYLSGATIVDAQQTNESEGSNETATTSAIANNGVGTFSNIDQYLESVKGKVGSKDYSALLIKYRQTFLNIDMMVINDLEELFLGLW